MSAYGVTAPGAVAEGPARILRSYTWRRRPVQVRWVPPLPGVMSWKVPPLRSARPRMLVRPLERAGVPTPRPLSMTSRMISPSCCAREMLTAVAWAWRGHGVRSWTGPRG